MEKHLLAPSCLPLDNLDRTARFLSSRKTSRSTKEVFPRSLLGYGSDWFGTFHERRDFDVVSIGLGWRNLQVERCARGGTFGHRRWIDCPLLSLRMEGSKRRSSRPCFLQRKSQLCSLGFRVRRRGVRTTYLLGVTFAYHLFVDGSSSVLSTASLRRLFSIWALRLQLGRFRFASSVST